MANEITLNLSLKVAKSYLQQTMAPGTVTADLSGTNATGGSQNIGTSAEAIVMNDVTTAGYAFFRNLGPTNYVEIGTGTGTNFAAFAKLKAGEPAVIRLGTSAPTAKANSAAIDLQYFILAD